MKNLQNAPSNTYHLISQACERFNEQTAITFLKAISPDFLDDKISYAQLLVSINRTARLLRDRLNESSEQRGGNILFITQYSSIPFYFVGKRSRWHNQPAEPTIK